MFDATTNFNDLESTKSGTTALSTTVTLYVIVANTMLIYSLLKIHKNLTLPKKLFVGLSCVDVVLVISTFIVTIIFYYGDYLQHETITALKPMTISLGLLSFEILCTISTHRYLSIKKPLLQINPCLLYTSPSPRDS